MTPLTITITITIRKSVNEELDDNSSQKHPLQKKQLTFCGRVRSVLA
jgi:hypothetical protein